MQFPPLWFTPPAPGITGFISPYKVNPRMGDNVATLGIPYPDRSALYRA
jgi:hypothetical protein